MTLRQLPNVITGLRIILVVPIVLAILNNNYSLACSLFVLAGISDGLDGFLARQFNWISRLGSIMDPIADKILLMSCFIVLALKSVVPAWLPIIIILRDLWVMSGAVAYHYLISRYELAPIFLSKINTFLQILLLLLTLVDLGVTEIKPALLTFTLWLTMISCVLSGIHYTYIWGKKAWKAYTTRRRE